MDRSARLDYLPSSTRGAVHAGALYIAAAPAVLHLRQAANILRCSYTSLEELPSCLSRLTRLETISVTSTCSGKMTVAPDALNGPALQECRLGFMVRLACARCGRSAAALLAAAHCCAGGSSSHVCSNLSELTLCEMQATMARFVAEDHVQTIMHRRSRTSRRRTSGRRRCSRCSWRAAAGPSPSAPSRRCASWS